MNRLRRATRLLLAAGAGLLVACGPAPGEAPMSGYAEAELVFVAPSTAGLLQTLAFSTQIKSPIKILIRRF